MKCVYCKNQVFIRNLCRKCFIRSFEKRARKELRGKLTKNSKVYVKDKICRVFVKELNVPLKFVKQNYDFKFVLWTLDDECEDFLKRVFSNKSLKVKSIKKEIKLFRTIPEDEVIAYGKLKGVTVKAKKSSEREWLNEISEEYKETKFSLLKSIDEIKAIK